MVSNVNQHPYSEAGLRERAPRPGYEPFGDDDKKDEENVEGHKEGEGANNNKVGRCKL